MVWGFFFPPLNYFSLLVFLWDGDAMPFAISITKASQEKASTGYLPLPQAAVPRLQLPCSGSSQLGCIAQTHHCWHFLLVTSQPAPAHTFQSLGCKIKSDTCEHLFCHITLGHVQLCSPEVHVWSHWNVPESLFFSWNPNWIPLGLGEFAAETKLKVLGPFLVFESLRHTPLCKYLTSKACHLKHSRDTDSQADRLLPE